MRLSVLFLFLFAQQILCVLPPKFQWKYIDYLWENNSSRDDAIKTGDYIPKNNLPFGLARWKDKLFITIPRMKKGVPSSLNYIMLNGSCEQPLTPYPNWQEGFVSDGTHDPPTNRSVVCAFRAYVDSCDRLWTVDNGVSDITGEVKRISDPAIMVFDLKTDELLQKFVLGDNVIRSSSVFTGIVVDVIPGKEKNCRHLETFAYITDMGSNCLVIFSLKGQEAWRVENPYFHFDPNAGTYRVGGIDFYWKDGISSATLSKPTRHGFRDLYFHPTSSTMQFKISTKLLRDKNTPFAHIFKGVYVVGDKGEMSQATACDIDPRANVLFYTQLSKNGVACWSMDRPFTSENNPVILSDCNMMEFPNDVKVDHEHNLWMLSNRQSRFLYGDMDLDQVNFRVLTAPVSDMIRGTPCEKQSILSKVFGSRHSKKSGTSNGKDGVSKSKDGTSVSKDGTSGSKDGTSESKNCPCKSKDGISKSADEPTLCLCKNDSIVGTTKSIEERTLCLCKSDSENGCKRSAKQNEVNAQICQLPCADRFST